MTNNILSVGDYVLWRDSWGECAPKPAQVLGIELCERERKKYGIEQKQVFWSDVRRCVLTLSGSKWAYGFQVSKLEGATVVYEDERYAEEEIVVGSHQLHVGGSADHWCYAHHTFDCEMTDEEKKQLNNPKRY